MHPVLRLPSWLRRVITTCELPLRKCATVPRSVWKNSRVAAERSTNGWTSRFACSTSAGVTALTRRVLTCADDWEHAASDSAPTSTAPRRNQFWDMRFLGCAHLGRCARKECWHSSLKPTRASFEVEEIEKRGDERNEPVRRV